MKKYPLVLVLLLLIAVGITIDFYASKTPNPYTAPPVLAWGSGNISSGGHCADIGVSK
tara:strand:- start:39275 stop:39448 length:174 start_codon:yes stop_codon:yes gene_type:complete